MSRYDTLLLVMLVSFAIQVATLISHTYLLKKPLTAWAWIVAGFLQLIGFFVLTKIPINHNTYTIFIGFTIFLLSDIVRLANVDMEFNLKIKTPIYWTMVIIFIGIMNVTLFYSNNLHLSTDIFIGYRILLSLYGLLLMYHYRGASIRFSRIMLILVYLLLVGFDSYFLFGHNHVPGFIIFDSNPNIIFIFEIIKSYVWVYTAITFHINQTIETRDIHRLKYETLFNTNPDIQFMVKEDNLVIAEVNKSFVDSTGLDYDAVIGTSLADLDIFVNMSQIVSLYNDIKDKVSEQSIEFRGLLASGYEFVGLIDVNRIDISGESFLVNSVKNVSEINQFKQINKVLNSVVNQNPVAVVVTDLDGDITYVNSRFTEITGYSKEEAIGQNPRLLKSGVQNAAFYEHLWDTILNGDEFNDEIVNRHKDGHHYWENIRIMPVKDDGGRIIAFLSMKDDITEQKEKEAQLKKKATIDDLTGINNRGTFLDRFRYTLNKFRFANQMNGFIMIDIDDFKEINDTYGHGCGDQVLYKTANYLLDSLRNDDVVGRLGGEEFGIIVMNTNRDNLQQVAERICETIATGNYTDEHGQLIRVTVSVGATLFDDGKSLEKIMKVADDALYTSKRNGKNQVTLK